MTDLRTAAQQALEALEMLAQPTKTNSETPRYKAHKAAITALRAALAQETQTPCDIAEDGVCEVIDCCRNSTQEEQEPTVRFKCTVVDDQHPNGVPFEQWVNAPQQELPKGGGNLPPPLAGRAGAAAQREKVAHWMRNLGYATGHGDSIEDLLDHLGTQIAEGLEAEALTEREACAKVCEGIGDGNKWSDAHNCAAAIRARSKK